MSRQLKLNHGISDLAKHETLTSAERLELQQLLQLNFWERQAESKEVKHLEEHAEAGHQDGLPAEWKLTQGIELHGWQQACVNAWFQAGLNGVLKVVTGAGKTILALAIIEKLQRSRDPDLRVAIVVPTVVLLAQWRHEIATRSNLPPEAIGLLGGGSDDTFNSQTRILICVLNSAARKLPEIVAKSGAGSSLLLVVDECHRAGSKEMRRVFEVDRAYSLGLSATPDRESDIAESEAEFGESAVENSNGVDFSDTVLGQELGPVIFELNYADAIELGVLPPFDIMHYGLSLRSNERASYEKISREISELRKELERPGRRGLGLIRWCRSSAAASNPFAARLLSLTAQRKRLLFRMSERTQATIAILRDAFAENIGCRAIIFHESIDQVMELFSVLRAEGFPVVAEHSEFPDSMRSEALDLFRQGAAQIIVSARSLIEGFNVPSADLGIVVAASSSVRQRIQTLGRLLRKSRNREGQEKRASLYVLYAAGTVDELIYEKANWETFVGAERNRYFVWSDVREGARIEIGTPPRTPVLGEMLVDDGMLQPGESYPGDTDEGREFTRDSAGTIRTADGSLIEPNEELVDLLKGSRKAAGRFRITPTRQYVIELEKVEDGWRGVYLGTLRSPVRTAQLSEDPVDLASLRPGDSYPLSRAHGKIFSVLQRDSRLIARKDRGEIRFVIPADLVLEVEKRSALMHIQSFLERAYREGHRISKITVTNEGHVVYVFNNQAVFVGLAPEGAEGFVFETK
ncbi:DEAD/DEAH box helicase [Bradyrhizobium yuanmingense]|uniref:DEAD/DEAH box helicase n=1 Tax=Bradyrhizobium yuanmingense TaxID=108015 RepID=UPI000FE3D035|nr:DEAD/DEAH box helicase [Bradyrhizobium yuanmingense]TGN77241.1 DEAD/DEAH box helicase [Bradyrhizobium yuanmingense]